MAIFGTVSVGWEELLMNWKHLPLLLGVLIGTAFPSISCAQEYTWTTIAGQAGLTGTNNGTGADARLFFPCGVALDSAGTVYVADSGNDTVRQLNLVGTNWVTTTILGMGAAFGTNDGVGSSTRFYSPQGITCGELGQLFITDTFNATIRSATNTGGAWVTTTIAGAPDIVGSTDGTGSQAHFHMPKGIGMDRCGNLYVADCDPNFLIPISTVRRLVSAQNNSWNVTTPVGTAGINGSRDGTNSSARFDGPVGVAVDSATNIYVTDQVNCEIRKIQPVGTNWVVTTLAGMPGLGGSIDGTNGAARFLFPDGVAVDPQGNLYVADTDNNTIRKMSALGTNWVVSTIGGTAGSQGSADGAGNIARFNASRDVAVDGARNLYVCDTYNSTIRFGRFSLTLKCEYTANQLILSWPRSGIDFQLETCGNLNTGATWSPVTNAVQLQTSSLVVNTAVGSASAFYRLHAR
jgi:sugar lactone lactonase YvrE